MLLKVPYLRSAFCPAQKLCVHAQKYPRLFVLVSENGGLFNRTLKKANLNLGLCVKPPDSEATARSEFVSSLVS